VKISLTALFLSELGETQQLEQTAIRKSPVAGFHQGGGFQPRLVEIGEGIVTSLLVRLIP